MANPIIRKVLKVTAASSSFTGSAYKVCADGTAGDIMSASFGWKSGGQSSLEPNDVVSDLSFAVGGDAAAENVCVEADFSYVSASVGLNIYYKSQGGDWSISNGSGEG